MQAPARRFHMVHFPPKRWSSRWTICLHTQLSSKRATLKANNPNLCDNCKLRLVQKNKRRRNINSLLMKILTKTCKVILKSKISKSWRLRGILTWLRRSSRKCELMRWFKNLQRRYRTWKLEIYLSYTWTLCQRPVK